MRATEKGYRVGAMESGKRWNDEDYIEHLGGAMGRVPCEDTAFVHRSAPFDLIVIAGGFRPEDTEKNVRWARATSDAMRPFMSGGAYVNYLGADAGIDAVRSAYGPAYQRLVTLKDTYDPANVFRLNQPGEPPRLRASTRPSHERVSCQVDERASSQRNHSVRLPCCPDSVGPRPTTVSRNRLRRRVVALRSRVRVCRS
jgi:Berberine and berberine like